MEIIFDGRNSRTELLNQLTEVLEMFEMRYQINNFREMHFTLTLVDKNGDDVELVDTQTAEVYRYFEVHSDKEESLRPRKGKPCLRLVVDNTKSFND